MSLALVRPIPAIVWELRAAWATGRRIALRIDADVPRVEGRVESVAASGSYAVVGGCHVPADRVLAVFWASRLGDSDYDERSAWSWPIHEVLLARMPGQMRLW